MCNRPLPFLPALLALSVSTTGFPSNQLFAQEAKPRTTPVLVHVFADLSLVHPELEGRKNSGRTGMVVTHYPSGWGIGYARQRLDWRGDGGGFHQTGWLGSYTIEPENSMTVRSIMAIKEFHLSSTDLFRPCLEAGVSFIAYSKDELVETVYSPEYTSRQYVATTSQVIGFDARFRAFLPIARAFALEAALHANFNEVRSYASIEFGLALGMVRPPKAKNRN